jgi:hypothetical protein
MLLPEAELDAVFPPTLITKSDDNEATIYAK